MRGDLTTLERYKIWSGLGAAADPLVERLISSSSAFIVSWLNKPVHLKAYVEKRSGNGSTTMVLKNWPVKEVISVSINGQSVPESNGSTPGFVHDGYNVFLVGGNYFFAKGVQNIVITYDAGFYLEDTITLPSAAPVQVTETSLSGVWVDDHQVRDSNNNLMTKVTGTPANVGEYSVSNKGVYLFHADAVNTVVKILYGTVPADVEQACMELILSRLKEKDRIGVASKSVANESVSYSQKDMTNFIKTSLSNYRAVIPL